MAEVYGRPDHTYGDLVNAAAVVKARLRAERDQAAVDTALAEVARVAAGDENIMPATIAAAKAGATARTSCW